MSSDRRSLLEQIETAIDEVVYAGTSAAAGERARKCIRDLEKLAREQVDPGSVDGTAVLRQISSAAELLRSGAAPMAVQVLKRAYRTAGLAPVG